MHPHHSLAANQNHVFLALLAPNFPIFPSSIQNFPHFSPFSLIQPISDKCTVTFRKRVFLRPELGVLLAGPKRHIPGQ